MAPGEHSTFGGITGKTVTDMRPFLDRTLTQPFLGIEFTSVIDSEWEDYALEGMAVEPEGIRFKHGNHFVPNASIVRILQLPPQNLKYEVPEMRSCSVDELTELGLVLPPEFKGKEGAQVPYSSMNQKKGLKYWTMRMHERVFIKVKPSSIPPGMFWAIREIEKDPTQILSWLKKGIEDTSVSTDSKVSREKSSPYNQMLAYILRGGMPRRTLRRPQNVIPLGSRSVEAVKDSITKTARVKVRASRSLSSKFDEESSEDEPPRDDRPSEEREKPTTSPDKEEPADTAARKGKKKVLLQCEEGPIEVDVEEAVLDAAKEAEPGRGEGSNGPYEYPRSSVEEAITRVGEPGPDVWGRDRLIELRNAAQEGIYLDDQK